MAVADGRASLLEEQSQLREPSNSSAFLEALPVFLAPDKPASSDCLISAKIWPPSCNCACCASKTKTIRLPPKDSLCWSKAAQGILINNQLGETCPPRLERQIRDICSYEY